MKTKMLIVGIVLAALLVTVSSVSAETRIWTEDAAGQLATDFDPGDTVYISGEGFSIVDGTEVQIAISRPDPDGEDVCPTSPPDGSGTCGPLPTTVGGAFERYEYKLDGIYGEYFILASDGANSAGIGFTDGPSPTYTVESYESDYTTVKNTFRRGETVYAEVTRTPPRNKMMKVRFKNPSGVVVHTSPEGTSPLQRSYTLPLDAPTGQWTIQIGTRHKTFGGYCWWWHPTPKDHFTVCEQSIEDILNTTYGQECWQPSTVETFYATGPGSYTAKAIVAGTNCANTNPTGWYVAGSTADTDKTQMWADPCNPTEGEQTIGPLGAGDSFGLYIDSDESGIMYYTETSLNPEVEIHAEVFKIICGDADFVVAFEDLPDSPWGVCEPDYNDVIIELRDASSEPIPEFATIALPALSVLGLFLYFNRRKQRKE